MNSTLDTMLTANETAIDSNQSNGTEVTLNPYAMQWYLQIMYCLVFAIMVLVAAGGNIIVIWIVLGNKKMRTVTNYFLLNLALSDAMITIFNTMFNFIYLLYSNWPFGLIYCKFSMFISPCTISASVFTFIAIALDRYMAIIHPLKPRIGGKKVIAVIIVIWILSMAVAYPNFHYAKLYIDSSRSVCYLHWPDFDSGNLTDIWYTIFLMLLTYIVPLLILAVTYSRVGCELWGHKSIGEISTRQLTAIQSKRRIVKMMVIVVIIFAVCWLPQHAFFIISNRFPSINDTVWVQHLYLIIYWLAMSTSMYNPIIYCWMNARFRTGFKYALRCLPCVHWSSKDKDNIWGSETQSKIADRRSKILPREESSAAFMRAKVTNKSPE